MYRLTITERQEKIKEEKRCRSLARLVQVRQQASHAADRTRQRVQAESARQVARLKQGLAAEYAAEKENQLAQFEAEYAACLRQVGSAHLAAARQPDLSVPRRLLQDEQRQVAAVRHRAALQRVRDSQRCLDDERRRADTLRELNRALERVRADRVAQEGHQRRLEECRRQEAEARRRAAAQASAAAPPPSVVFQSTFRPRVSFRDEVAQTRPRPRCRASRALQTAERGSLARDATASRGSQTRALGRDKKTGTRFPEPATADAANSAQPGSSRPGSGGSSSRGPQTSRTGGAATSAVTSAATGRSSRSDMPTAGTSSATLTDVPHSETALTPSELQRELSSGGRASAAASAGVPLHSEMRAAPDQYQVCREEGGYDARAAARELEQQQQQRASSEQLLQLDRERMAAARGRQALRRMSARSEYGRLLAELEKLEAEERRDRRQGGGSAQQLARATASLAQQDAAGGVASYEERQRRLNQLFEDALLLASDADASDVGGEYVTPARDLAAEFDRQGRHVAELLVEARGEAPAAAGSPPAGPPGTWTPAAPEEAEPAPTDYSSASGPDGTSQWQTGESTAGEEQYGSTADGHVLPGQEFASTAEAGEYEGGDPGQIYAGEEGEEGYYGQAQMYGAEEGYGEEQIYGAQQMYPEGFEQMTEEQQMYIQQQMYEQQIYQEQQMQQQMYGEGEQQMYGEGEQQMYGEGEQQMYGEGEEQMYGEGGQQMYGEGEEQMYGESEQQMYQQGEQQMYSEGEEQQTYQGQDEADQQQMYVGPDGIYAASDGAPYGSPDVSSMRTADMSSMATDVSTPRSSELSALAGGAPAGQTLDSTGTAYQTAPGDPGDPALAAGFLQGDVAAVSHAELRQHVSQLLDESRQQLARLSQTGGSPSTVYGSASGHSAPSSASRSALDESAAAGADESSASPAGDSTLATAASRTGSAVSARTAASSGALAEEPPSAAPDPSAATSGVYSEPSQSAAAAAAAASDAYMQRYSQVMEKLSEVQQRRDELMRSYTNVAEEMRDAGSAGELAARGSGSGRPRPPPSLSRVSVEGQAPHELSTIPESDFTARSRTTQQDGSDPVAATPSSAGRPGDATSTGSLRSRAGPDASAAAAAGGQDDTLSQLSNLTSSQEYFSQESPRPGSAAAAAGPGSASEVSLRSSALERALEASREAIRAVTSGGAAAPVSGSGQSSPDVGNIISKLGMRSRSGPLAESRGDVSTSSSGSPAEPRPVSRSGRSSGDDLRRRVLSRQAVSSGSSGTSSSSSSSSSGSGSAASIQESFGGSPGGGSGGGSSGMLAPLDLSAAPPPPPSAADSSLDTDKFAAGVASGGVQSTPMKTGAGPPPEGEPVAGLEGAVSMQPADLTLPQTDEDE